MTLTWWDRFASLHHGVTVKNMVDDLLARGVSGLSALRELADLRGERLTPDQFRGFYLPWHEAGTAERPGAWWTGDRPLTVETWSWRPPVEEWMKEIIARSPLALGESLAVEDTGLKVTVIVDGCKRAIAAHLANVERPFLILRSAYAHMLYPQDFLCHVRNAGANTPRVTLVAKEETR